MDYERKKELWDFCIKEREQYQKKANEEQKQFDSNILKFSAGAFALSFTVINTFIPLSESHYKLLLLISWVSFALSLITGLLGHLLSVNHYESLRDYEDERYKISVETDEMAEPVFKDKYYFSIGLNNKLTAIFFFVGIGALLCFVFLNV